METPNDRAYKQALATLFSRTSETHDAVGPTIFGHFGAVLVELAALREGDRVLDVGAGTGATLFPAARRVGASGRVVGLDLAPGMVDHLAASIAEQGVGNADAIVADAEAIPFADESFDRLLCAFTLFFLRNWRSALRDFERVLRRGGLVAVSTFTTAGSASIDRTWQQISPTTAGDPPADVARFDQPDQLEGALAEAGFVDIDIMESPLEVVMPTFDDWWAWLWTMEFREYLERLDAESLSRLRNSLEGDRGGRPGSPEIKFRMDALLARAYKP